MCSAESLKLTVAEPLVLHLKTNIKHCPQFLMRPEVSSSMQPVNARAGHRNSDHHALACLCLACVSLPLKMSPSALSRFLNWISKGKGVPVIFQASLVPPLQPVQPAVRTPHIDTGWKSHSTLSSANTIWIFAKGWNGCCWLAWLLT